MRIGLIADTHMPGSLQELWPQAMAAFEDVDYILHAGDLHTIDIIDQLSELAPTYVSRGNGDAGLVDDRIQDSWLFDLAGVSIGMIHRLPSPARKSSEEIFRYVDKHFERRPEVLIYGHTHLEGVHQVDDLLCINPGSPTLPRNQSLRPGTIGMLEIQEEVLTSAIFQITREGVERIDNIP
jgi:uncharacterized protein